MRCLSQVSWDDLNQIIKGEKHPTDNQIRKHKTEC